MARIREARLSVEGSGAEAVFRVELDLDWDRGDDDHDWEVVLRFVAADTGLRGGDDVVKLHTMRTRPDDGEHLAITVDNVDGVFDEDAGRDEIAVEATMHIAQPQADIVRSNKIKGRF